MGSKLINLQVNRDDLDNFLNFISLNSEAEGDYDKAKEFLVLLEDAYNLAVIRD